MNLERARFNMIEQQIRTWDVLDPEVLDLLYTVRREEFVPPAYQALAFSDLEIPLFDAARPGERMLQPKLEARIVQELALRPSDKVLEIGTGSGYLTALLAARTARVISVEISPRLVAFAADNLGRAGIGNVTLEQGNGVLGWARFAPYDVIVLGGSVPALPPAFLEQLLPGGRLFAVCGDAPVMSARLVTRVAGGAHSTADLFETVLAPLENAPQPERFHF
jgi:protein-L-isoaspartate(D-aspartate) O-methyltransferase